MLDKLSEYLSAYNFRAVFVYATKDKHVNAYQFYNFDEMRKYRWPESYINRIRQILPPKSLAIIVVQPSLRSVGVLPSFILTIMLLSN